MMNDLRSPDGLERLCFWILKISNGLLGALLLLSFGVLTYNMATTPNVGDEIIGIGGALFILLVYASLFLANVFLKINTRYRLLFRANGVVLVIISLLMLLVIIFARSGSLADNWWMPMIFLWPALNLILLRVIRRRKQALVHETFA